MVCNYWHGSDLRCRCRIWVTILFTASSPQITCWSQVCSTSLKNSQQWCNAGGFLSNILGGTYGLSLLIKNLNSLQKPFYFYLFGFFWCKNRAFSSGGEILNNANATLVAWRSTIIWAAKTLETSQKESSESQDSSRSADWWFSCQSWTTSFIKHSQTWCDVLVTLSDTDLWQFWRTNLWARADDATRAFELIDTHTQLSESKQPRETQCLCCLTSACYSPDSISSLKM